jgi:hypothetical protein
LLLISEPAVSGNGIRCRLQVPTSTWRYLSNLHTANLVTHAPVDLRNRGVLVGFMRNALQPHAMESVGIGVNP